jgi:hypothetical protein
LTHEKKKENTSAAKSLYRLPAALYLAQKMGKSMGRCKILQR